MVVLPGPGTQRLQVVGSPSRSAPTCPASEFDFSPLSPPQGGLHTGPGLANHAFAHLQVGQTVTLYQGPGDSITLTRGVSNAAFSLSLNAQGPKPLNEIGVLGDATYYYPPGSGLAGGRIPFRFPGGRASASDACDRYQLVGTGVVEPSLMGTAERFGALVRVPNAPTTTYFLPTSTTAAPVITPSTATAGPAADPVASAFNHCPNPAPLVFDANASANALATARAAVALVYTNIDTTGYQINSSGPASPSPQGQANPGYYILPYGMCGSTVGSRTYVVELYFPAMASRGTDLSHGQLFLSRFPQGWQAWYRYH